MHVCGVRYAAGPPLAIKKMVAVTGGVSLIIQPAIRYSET